MNAILVSVDYTDLLSVSLPWNRSHFDNVLVVTSRKDMPNVQPVCEKHNTSVYATDTFYTHGAVFNKFAAMEEALDVFAYRHGWICIMDADVLWPKVIPSLNPLLKVGNLISPLRRMFTHEYPPGQFQVPPESTWARWPIHNNVNEWAGYSQIFHGDDPVLGKPPWHQVDWSHAGGADSFFQFKWNPANKVRPPWQCLHIGEAGLNWMGRASRNIQTGEVPEDAAAKRLKYLSIWPERRKRQIAGLDPFGLEKIDPKV